VTTRAERTSQVIGDVTVTLATGGRTASARLHAEAGTPVVITVTDPAVMWREMARPVLRDTVRRWAALTAVDVEDTHGRRLLRSVPRGGRARPRWTAAGLVTLAGAGWLALRRR
jgi:hypothetical protein